MTRFLTFLVLFSLGFVSNIPANATAFQLLASKTDYQSKLAGDWEVDSEVVWSESAYVKEGELSKSEIIISDIHGSLYPQWKAQDWKLVRNKVIDFNIDKYLN